MLTRARILFFLCIGLIAALPSVALAKEGDLTIIRAFSGWRDAASFKRISEYFDGKENTGHEKVLRTHAGERAGYYFLVRTSNAGGPVAAQLKLTLIAPTEPKVRNFSFAADLPSGVAVLNLGLTGTDWPDAKANPVAWKLDIVAPDGRVLATEKSYLWEKPGAK